MTAGDGQPGLPSFQWEVARLFFALPASKGFLLAGGAALLAQHLTARPTGDLDFFTAPERGHWNTERIHDSDTFWLSPDRSYVLSVAAGEAGSA
ncbi:MAG TPA: hypothetical protein VHZ03_01920 [Trebonia sp.]|nr:hypothetical protein [Trebonia sp.]